MQRKVYFIEGLKIFVLAAELFSAKDQPKSGFTALMKKNGDQPIKVITG